MKAGRNEEFEELVSRLKSYLENVPHYSTGTIRHFKTAWNLVHHFMITKGIKEFSRSVGERALVSKFGKIVPGDLRIHEREYLNGISLLVQFQETGKIDKFPRRAHKSFEFKGQVGKKIQEYIDYRKSTGVSDSWLRHRKYALFLFSEFCSKESITRLNELCLPSILSFIQRLRKGPTIIGLVIYAVRGFTKYLFEEGYIKKRIDHGIPKQKTIKPKNLPDIYSPDELKRLMKTFKKSNPAAKRDYAIVRMLVEFGLRPSDVANLKFEDIKWTRNEITLRQPKNGRLVVKKLTPEVGNALLEYIKFGRPASDERVYVFLSEKPPKPAITANGVAALVSRAFQSSKVNPKGRSLFPKVFRYSRTSRMLKEKIPYNIIANDLGHSGTESLPSYTRIDPDALMKCALEVPPIPKIFYKEIIKYYHGHRI